MVVRSLTSFESHSSETSYASSVYIKVTLLRWVNTAIVTAIISPFVYTIEDGSHLIDSLRVLFTAELVQRPILQLLDWMGNLKRHVFAPRAKDQRRMNLLFMSGYYSIGERYTDVTKLLFLTCFYAPLYPAAWFFSAVILVVYYWMDKFCVLRTWKQGPKINGDISIYSVYFFLMCVITYAVMAAYDFAMFPFDNACKTGAEVPDDYLGVYEFSDEASSFEITTEDSVYKFCEQDLFRYVPAAFPPLPSSQPEGSEWMSPSQLKFAPIYGWCCVGVVVLVGATFLFRMFLKFILPLFSRTYKLQGKPMEEAFSEVHEICGYVPNVIIPGYLFPFLLCDVSNIDNELIGWTGFDSEKSDLKNLIDDMPLVLRRTKSKKNLQNSNPRFSQIMSWAPTEDIVIKTETSPRDDSMGSLMFRFFFQ